jgi:predicted secreted protein
MAIAGNGGSLYVGGTPTKVAEISAWSLEVGADPIETTSLDDSGWKTFIAGIKEWSGSAEGNFKFTDTNGQFAVWGALTGGTTLAAEFRLSDTHKLAGTICVQGISVENPVDDKVSVSFEFQGTAALTYT